MFQSIFPPVHETLLAMGKEGCIVPVYKLKNCRIYKNDELHNPNEKRGVMI